MSYWGFTSTDLKKDLGALGVDLERHQRESKEKVEHTITTVKTAWKYRNPIALVLVALASWLAYKIFID